MRNDIELYTGRWIALVRGRVAGVGHTATAAAHMARRNWPKDKIETKYVEPAGGKPLSLPPLLSRLRPILEQENSPIYLVGGSVRDALLGRPSHDLDFVVPEGAVHLSFRVANKLGAPAYILDKERDTGRVVLAEENTTLDFARFRDNGLEADLRDRDFTINAMALPAAAQTSSSLIDPCGGQTDLAAGILRQTHNQAIADDPVRALRAIRLAVELDFNLAEETAAAVAQAAPLLSGVSAERVRDEWSKLLSVDAPHLAVAQMERLNLLAAIAPELAALQEVAQSPPHHENVLSHTLRVLRWLVQLEQILENSQPPADPRLAETQAALAPFKERLKEHLNRPAAGAVDGRLLLRTAALFHDVGKAETQSVSEDGRIRFLGHDKVGAAMAGRRLKQLRFSNEATAHIRGVVAGHMRPLLFNQEANVSRRAIHRFFRAYGSAGLDICLLSLADHLATYDAPDGWTEEGRRGWRRLLSLIERLLAYYFSQFEAIVQSVPLVSGHDLIREFDLEAGPEIGRLLRLIEEAQAAGEVHTKEEALALAARLL